jgi:CRP-like cAMP-binding protein
MFGSSGMIGRDQEVVTLGSVPWFRAASSTQLRHIARHACRLRFVRRSVPVRAGTPALDFLVVVSGRVCISRRGQPPHVLGPGGHACGLDVLARSQHRYNVVALTEVDVLVIDRRSLYGLLDTMPQLASRVVRELAPRLRALETDRPEG